MNPRYAGIVAALALASHCMPVHAQSVPEWFVPEEQCKPRDCTCDDIPLMEKFLANNRNALTQWATVRADILTPTGPATPDAAIKLFENRFKGDKAILAQFKTCPNYDPAKNMPDKIAGVTPLGDASLDPCFCAAFCRDIVDATILHERMHVPTIVAGVVGRGDTLVACSLGITSGRVCDAVAPLALADSEVISYGAGNAFLEKLLNQLKAMDPVNPQVECTWMTVGAAPSPKQALIPSPAGFMARLALLWERIVHGAAPESVATRDAADR